VDIGAVLTGRALHAVALEPGPVGGRGWALLAELKRRPETHSIPVILCTAQDERRRGLEMGVAVYLVKPILPADLLATIRRIVGENISEGGLT
jgi:DNA-binding response OmpR family regulator